MDFRQIVRMGLEEGMAELRMAVEGLTPEERRFMPSPTSHHVDFAAWHTARVEDEWVNDFAKHTDQVWNRRGWYQRLGIPEKDGGFGYAPEQVRGLARFELDDLMAYYQEVRKETLEYLDSLTEQDLDRCPWPEQAPGYTIGRMWSHLLVHQSQHAGQVAYLRGLQRGLNQ